MMEQIRRWNGWHWVLLLLVLLTAVSLRLYNITSAPPGLTHDEADHGITALGILQGEGAIYFTIGHGREPLYDYVTAAVMAVIGPTYLAGRLTAVFFSLISIVGLYAWTYRAFDRSTALLAAAGLAVSFWGVMAARQSLRSITLPALFVLALWIWWRRSEGQRETVNNQRATINGQRFTIHNSQFTIHYFLSGLLLGLTFYTYIPARIMWLLFPAIVVYLAIVDREQFKRMWKGTAVTLFIAFLIALPLIVFLLNNPELEVRIVELSDPLTAARNGDFFLLWENTKNSLRLFTVEGDMTWRYNIPGKPLLPLVQGTLFYMGLLLAGWWAIRPLRKNSTPQQKQQGTAAFAALIWLLLGIAPVFVTGPELSMTQAMGVQPVLYLFPALVLGRVTKNKKQKMDNGQQSTINGQRTADNRLLLTTYYLLLTFFFVTIVISTARDYFGTWVNAPEVRVQYESTMVAAMDYVNKSDVRDVVISTITPGEFHSPALAKMMLTNTAVSPRWHDGRTSLLLPGAKTSVVIQSGFTPMHPALERYVNLRDPVTTLPLRETDLDRPLNIYEWQEDDALVEWQTIFIMEDEPVNFDDTLQLLGYDVQTPVVGIGEFVQVATLWQVIEPISIEMRLFTHVLGADGVPVLQQDKLDVPPESWQPSDYFIQLHTFRVKEETAVSQYPISVGAYTCPETCEKAQRLPILSDGEPVGDSLTIQMLEVTE
ncbi:MAG: hypothetical protein DWQ04_05240 [Chloroflexi bacterium]|nr:MAG: hypothetical protein DWQ04_05240 [Chloroflexota bacterium]